MQTTCFVPAKDNFKEPLSSLCSTASYHRGEVHLLFTLFKIVTWYFFSMIGHYVIALGLFPCAAQAIVAQKGIPLALPPYSEPCAAYMQLTVVHHEHVLFVLVVDMYMCMLWLVWVYWSHGCLLYLHDCTCIPKISRVYTVLYS